jgi:dTDP-4-dehydrorhamnose reductase
VPGPILVFGRTGQVARELAKLAPGLGRAFEFVGREQLDLLRNGPGVLIETRRPEAVINASAYTAVDRAESEPDAAFRLNRDIPGEMARACAAISAPLVHLSTDYVFGGGGEAPYGEDDALQPLGVYGRSKAEGEHEVRAAGGDAAIIRTSWVYSAFGANFLKTMLRLAGSRDEIRVVADQRGRPTWAEEVARGAWSTAERLVCGDPHATGVFHLAGGGEATWAEFAEAIFEEASRRGRPTARVVPITTAEYPTPAQRPADSRLATGKLETLLGWRPAPWRVSLSACMDEMEGE